MISAQWYMVYDSATGRAVSVGTQVSSALPHGLAVAALSGADADAVLAGDGAWDEATRSVVDVPSPLPECVETTRLSAWLASRGFDAVAAIREIEAS